MYKFNRRVQGKKKRYAFLRFMGKFAIFAAVIFLIWWYLHRPQVSINDSGAKLVPSAEDESKKHITEPFYAFDLPSDWVEYDRKSYPYHVVSWKGTSKKSSARAIDIFTDAIPGALAVNRMLPVRGEEDRLAVDEASDNCLQFSSETASLTPKDAALMSVRKVTFDRVEFWCDIPNSGRNVIGASSTEGINKVTVTGPKNGRHTYFFVYYDHDAHPDNYIFPEILRSFRAL